MSLLTHAHHSRIKFLHEAATAVAPHSPAVSAHITLQSTLLSSDPISSLPQNSCSACGAILTSGTRRVVIKGQRPLSTGSQLIPKSQFSISPISIPRIREIECLRCHRKSTETIHPIGFRQTYNKPALLGLKPEKLATATVKSPTSQATTATSLLTKVTKPSSSRSKSRKLGGLQQMLDKARGSQQTSKSLSDFTLMDFMKKS